MSVAEGYVDRVPAGPYDAVLVLSFGGPEGPDDVRPFLANVTRGRAVPEARLDTVAAHYARFGGVSPLNAACRELIAALERELATFGPDFPVYWGNRNWHPLLPETLARMRDDGIRRAVCFVTSPYDGYSSCRQYVEDIARARALVGTGAPIVDKLRPYFDHPGFVGPLVDNVALALAALDPTLRPTAHLACTAHSVPVSQPGVAAYIAELEETVRLVAGAASPASPFTLSWQSRSGSPTQPWLEPDISERLSTLARAGTRAAVLVPVGFVADHMEVVYDLDVVARAHAEELGLAVARAATVGAAPRFVTMIRELIAERTDPGAPHLRLGRLPLDVVETEGCSP